MSPFGGGFGHGANVNITIVANSAGAVRELDKLGLASQKAAAKVKRSSGESSRSIEGIGKSAKRTHGHISALGAAVGAGGLALGLRDVVKIGLEWQGQQAQLQNALKRTGLLGGGTLRQLSEAAQKLSEHGGFGEARNLQGLTMFVRATRSATRAQRDLGLATDVARGAHKDFDRVVRAIALAEQGHTTGLTRLGIALPKVTAAQDALKTRQSQNTTTLQHMTLAQQQHAAANKRYLEGITASGGTLTAQQRAQLALSQKQTVGARTQFQLANQITPAMRAQAKATDEAATKQGVLKQLEHLYHGSAQTHSKQTQGRIENMKHAWENLKRTLGTALIPTFNKLLNVGNKVLQFLNHHRTVLKVVIASVAAFSAALVITKIALAAAEIKTTLWSKGLARLPAILGAVTTAMEASSVGAGLLGAAMYAIPVLAIIGGLVLIATHFKQFKKIVGDVANWLKHHWLALAGVMTVILGPMGFVFAFIITHFKQVKQVVSDVIGWIGGHWKLLFGILTLGVGPAIVWIVQHFGGIKHAVSDVVGFIDRMFHRVLDAITKPFKQAWKIIKGIFNAIVTAVRWVVGQVKHSVSSIPKALSSGPLGAIVGAIGGPAVQAIGLAGAAAHGATGGHVTKSGIHPSHMAMGGPVGSDTIPLWGTPGEFMLRKAAAARIGGPALHHMNQTGQIPGGHGMSGVIELHHTTRLDSRVLADSVTRYALRKAARGPSTLVGGPMTTGAAAPFAGVTPDGKGA